MVRDIDIGILCELNTKNPPKIKGYQQFKNVSSSKKTNFHHICIYVKNKYQDQVLRVPDESNLEIVHLIFRQANPPLNIIGTYLDGERGDSEETTKIWYYLENKVNDIIDKGEGVLVMGDLNRPLNSNKYSVGKNLLENWLEEGQVKLINQRNIDTRYDPVTGNGSVLDLAIISENIWKLVKNFEVDSERKWTPFSIQKTGDIYSKKPSDHCAIQTNLKISLNMIKNRKRPIINFKNKDGWARYKVISDKYADKIKDFVKSNDNINTLRLNLDILNREIQIEAFEII